MDANVFVTVLTTVVSGVLVYVLGLLFNEYFLKPIQEYKELKAKISYALTFYANLYMNPTPESNEECSKASLELRKLAAALNALVELRPRGNIFIPSQKCLAEAAKSLTGLSNNFCSPNPVETMQRNEAYKQAACKFLGIKRFVFR